MVLVGAAVVAGLAACGSAGSPSAGSSVGTSGSPAATTAGGLMTARIFGATVLTNAKGFTLYSFAPDTSGMSNCNQACAQNWPPVKGGASAVGVKGTFATIQRADGSTRHAITTSASAAPAAVSSSASASGSGGYGY
jgi:predicted lipoprotein with Yx(FWY)xxD motif